MAIKKNVSECTKRVFTPQSIETFKLALLKDNGNELAMQASTSLTPSKCYSDFLFRYLEVFNLHLSIEILKCSRKKDPRHE